MERVRFIRKQQNLSQSDLAYKAGISQSMLSDIENGNVNPSIRILEKISNALEISVSEILD